ncbi:MAG: TVP38/TMEM64 family protein, partial [Pseudanabaena sp. M38BS1SP1A06MG]|nr:TVP38/TMEM64 family protein [Pseudanabaena sp. M38BS1SP1A06MG]
MNKKFLISIFVVTAITAWLAFVNIDLLNQIQAIAQESGIWGYAFFVITYAIATLLILPVTAFNIAGG